MKTSAIIVCIFLSAFTFAQSRVNDQLPSISTVKGQLVSATGWIKSPEGDWQKKANTIPVPKTVGYYADPEYVLGENKENFISYELRDIKIKDSTYALLVKKYRDGFFTYSAIREDWVNQTSLRYYIFPKSELKKLLTLKADSANSVEIRVLYNNILDFVNLKTMSTQLLAKDINSVIKGTNDAANLYKKESLIIGARVVPKTNRIQFMISDVINFFDGTDQYYETDLTAFKSFIPIAFL